MTKFIKLIGFGLAISALLAISTSSVTPSLKMSNIANASGTGGPIVLDGMDPVCHSGYEGTWGYIAQVLKKTHDGATNSNNGSIAILGSNGASNSCSGNWNTLLSTKYLSQFTSAPVVNFYNSASQVNDFFTNINTLKPAIIWLPDNWNRPAEVESAFTANAEVIADFVNSGGGLFANMGSYGWLTALLPSAAYNSGGCNGGPDATADGMADFGLTNIKVAACWHGYFTGSVGTLKVLVDYPFPTGSTRKAVSIGGGAVSLPSSFTLAISPTNPNAGEDLTITATAKTIAGVAQAGVTVTINVTSGPGAGQTLTAVTDSSGIATIVVRTSTQGTAVYTATALVNGVSKTVSATVSWNPPATTIAPETTEASTSTEVVAGPSTTEVQKTTPPEIAQVLPSTTVQEVEKTTTTVLVPSLEISSSPNTTIHNHLSHSHKSLPNTGSNIFDLFIFALVIFLIGFTLRFNKKGKLGK